MAAAKSRFDGLRSLLGGKKPIKPDSRANRAAFKVGAVQAKKGSTPALQRVVLLSLQNDARLEK